jgi:site-specific recombinase XerC
MTRAEQQRLLRASGRHPGDLREHILISLALGTGLRLAELLGLNVGDLSPDGKRIRRRVSLDPSITKGGHPGEVFLGPKLAGKLRRYLAWKKRRGEGMESADPLFATIRGTRLSKRRAQYAFKSWQEKAGFDRLFGFHSLRHSAVTNLYRATRDLLLTQRFARHSHLATTTTYTHPSDEDLVESVRGLLC